MQRILFRILQLIVYPFLFLCSFSGILNAEIKSNLDQITLETLFQGHSHRSPRSGEKVLVSYSTANSEGVHFQNGNGSARELPVNELNSCWKNTISKMSEGSVYRLHCPRGTAGTESVSYTLTLHAVSSPRHFVCTSGNSKKEWIASIEIEGTGQYQEGKAVFYREPTKIEAKLKSTADIHTDKRTQRIYFFKSYYTPQGALFLKLIEDPSKDPVFKLKAELRHENSPTSVSKEWFVGECFPQ